MQINIMFSALFCGLTLASPYIYASDECTNHEYSIYKEYNDALDAQPNTPTEILRAKYAKKLKMSKASIRDLHFRCTDRWVKEKRTDTSTAETKRTINISCEDLGYQYGKCATLTIIGKPCAAKNDFVMPLRCKASKKWDVGLRKGVQEIAPHGVSFDNGKPIQR